MSRILKVCSRTGLTKFTKHRVADNFPIRSNHRLNSPALQRASCYLRPINHNFRLPNISHIQLHSQRQTRRTKRLTTNHPVTTRHTSALRRHRRHVATSPCTNNNRNQQRANLRALLGVLNYGGPQVPRRRQLNSNQINFTRGRHLTTAKAQHTRQRHARPHNRYVRTDVRTRHVRTNPDIRRNRNAVLVTDQSLLNASQARTQFRAKDNSSSRQLADRVTRRTLHLTKRGC